MDVDALASAVFSGVPGARLAGIVDMQTALFLAIESGNCRPEEADALAVSVHQIFEGDVAAGLRRSLLPSPDAQRVEEVIVVGDKTVFFFSRIAGTSDAALVVACGRETNLGILLINARQLIKGT